MRLLHFAALCLLLLPCGARADDHRSGPGAGAAAATEGLARRTARTRGQAAGTAVADHRRARPLRHHLADPWPRPARPATWPPPPMLRPLDGGRWSIDALKLPPSGSFTMTIPMPATTARAAPMETAIHHRQAGHAWRDRSRRSPRASTLHSEFGDLVVSSNSAKQRQEQRFDRYVADTTLTPAQNGRLDLTMAATLGGWKSASRDQRRHADGDRHPDHARGRPDQRREPRARRRPAGRDRRPVRRAAPRHRDAGRTSPICPPPARAQLRLLVDSLQDMLTAVSVEESVDGLQVEIAGMGGLSMKHFLLASAASRPTAGCTPGSILASTSWPARACRRTSPHSCRIMSSSSRACRAC